MIHLFLKSIQIILLICELVQGNYNLNPSTKDFLYIFTLTQIVNIIYELMNYHMAGKLYSFNLYNSYIFLCFRFLVFAVELTLSITITIFQFLHVISSLPFLGKNLSLYDWVFCWSQDSFSVLSFYSSVFGFSAL